VLTQWFLDLAAGFYGWALSLLPSGPPPAWIVGFRARLGDVLDGLDGMGSWLDWSFALTVVLAVVGAWAVVLVVRAVRWLVGWIPTMGGGS
jgi:hypothetical protein